MSLVSPASAWQRRECVRWACGPSYAAHCGSQQKRVREADPAAGGVGGREEDGAGRAGESGEGGGPVPAVCEPGAVRELREMIGGANGVGGVKGTKLSQEF